MHPFVNIPLLVFAVSFCITLFIWVFSQLHGFVCPVWLSWLIEWKFPFMQEYQAEALIRRLDLKSGMTVIDVGCGPGRLTIPIALAVGPTGKVLAVDIQEGMLNRVRKRANEAGCQNIDFLQTEAGSVSGYLPENSVDRALMVTMFGEIPKRMRRKTMQEIYELLKPGGLLSITETIYDPHYKFASTVLDLAQSCGFEEKSQFGHAFTYTLVLEKSSDLSRL